MKYCDFEKVLSTPRLGKYSIACNGDQRKTLMLYRNNIKLCQRFYGVLSIFEVALRNAINNHFKNSLADNDWLRNQSQRGFLVRYRDSINKELARLNDYGIYTNDKLLSSLSFGVWTYMFSRVCYKNSGKTLLRIFPNKIRGLNQKDIYHDLDRIRIFRNRIAHYEPICFDRSGHINVNYSLEIYNSIAQYITFLGHNPKELLRGVENPVVIIEKIRDMQ
jgi:hypothetical protein